ncbi:hypothetical protein [Novosphingobium sp. ERW19]|uniref:hypothetical protein n=1 Tax=Novosphingobium sp. ERW19 TaxID=2726186 RepID=UPI0014565780|nr:hypothetical protein [Novosphingobium sp. ERW19]NLR40061.1 hypothetical protein [Novosphingobium sp. ERW19]
MDEVKARQMIAQFAAEHLEQMKGVDWASFSRHLKDRFPRTGGETFGCEEDGQYFDVGDNVAWVAEVDGDILLTAFAATQLNGQEIKDARSIVIQRP